MRLRNRVGNAHLRQQCQRDGGTAYVRGQRTGAASVTGRRCDQGQIGFAQIGKFVRMCMRCVDQHAVEQAGQHGFDRAFPTGVDFEHFAETT